MYDPKFSVKQMYSNYGSSFKSNTINNANKQAADSMRSAGVSGLGSRPTFNFSRDDDSSGADNNPNRDAMETRSPVEKLYDKAVTLLRNFGASEPEDVIVDGKAVYKGPAFRGYDPTTRIGDFGGEYGKKQYLFGMPSLGEVTPRSPTPPTLPPAVDNPSLNMFGVTRNAFRTPDPMTLPDTMDQDIPETSAALAGIPRALAKAATVPTPPTTEEDYIIQVGDTLSEIAQDRGTTVEVLQEMNNIPDSKKDDIFAGDKLKVPPKITPTQAALRRGLGSKKDYGEGVETAFIGDFIRGMFKKPPTGFEGMGPDPAEQFAEMNVSKIKTDFVDGYLKGHEGVKAHKSLEGGKDTAAYGVKNSLGLKRSDYKSDRDFAAAVALKHYNQTENDFIFDFVWDELGEAGRYALTDLHYNVGTVGSSAVKGTAKEAITNTLNYVGMTTKDGTKASLLSLSKRRAENWNKAAKDLGLDKIDKIQQMPRAGGGTIIKYLNAKGDVIHQVSSGRKPITLRKNGTYKELTGTKEVKIN